MSATSYLSQLAPEWIILVGAFVVLFAGVTRVAANASGLAACSCLTVLVAFLVTVFGDAPDGSWSAVGLWTTSLTHYVRCIGLGVGLLILLVNWHQPSANERGEYFAMILFSLLGVLLTASANDLVVFFLAVELVSVPTYVLIALSRDDSRAAEASVKYFFLGAMAAAFLAYGLSFLYGASGTTTLFQITDGRAFSAISDGSGVQGYCLIGLLLVLGGLAFKVAAVPFHAYAPDVYEGAASPVTGLLGFLPKLAGFVALIKVFSAFDWNLSREVLWLLWVLAAASMTIGNVLALLQSSVKRMLAYSSIAHTGYMLIALLVGPVPGEGPMRDGVAALLFYVAVYGVMNLGVFAMFTAFQQRGGGSIEQLDDLSGLAARAPMSALAFAICVFSLMGFPPTAGFLGKLYIFGSALSVSAGHPFRGPLLALVVIGLINSAIAAAYYLRLVASIYSTTEAKHEAQSLGGVPVRWGLALCSLPLLLLFAMPSALSKHSSAGTNVLRRTMSAADGKLTQTAESPAELTSKPSSMRGVGVLDSVRGR